MSRHPALILCAVLLVSTSCISPSVAPPPSATVSGVNAATPPGAWTTYHHDDAHTGYDPYAPAVTTVGPTSGWTETVLDDQVYAEPLIYGGLVYAATLNNTVYALKQSTGAVVWQKHLGAPVTTGWQCGNVSPTGILGTPVIDVARGRIYVAALFNGDHLYRVVGLDLATGRTSMEKVIPASIGGGFDWTIQQERGALAVANGYVYVPFGGRNGDCGAFHGYLVGVPTNASSVLTVYVTPGGGNGFWASGGVVVDDSTGRVFVTSGNGNVASGCNANADGTPQFENDAVVRLAPWLDHLDFFMPQDWQKNWCSNDQDLGSANPLLISPKLLFQAGKWGGGFLLNPNQLGGVDGQLFPTPKPAMYVQAEVCLGIHEDATFGSVAYAAPFIFAECEGSGGAHGLVALKVDMSTSSFSPCDARCGAPDWHAGAPNQFGPPIVAGGAVWTATRTNGGGLYAFNAKTGALIYRSAPFPVNRFVSPAEAGGQVFVPSAKVIKSFTFAMPGS
jgi:outer membrane protein assembly factor BamB